MKLSNFSEDFLWAYLEGQKSEEELGDWLVGVEYDEEIGRPERDRLAAVRLMLIEYCEGMRPREHVEREAAAALVESRGEPFSYTGSTATLTLVEAEAVA
jgi:hypothetical protein